MKLHKLRAGFFLLLFSAIALATTWYLPYKVPGSYLADSDAEWSTAANLFTSNQLAMNSTGSMKQGDLVTVEYSDGTIVQFTLGIPASCAQRCVWSDEPWDPSKKPIVKQGKGGKAPSNLNVYEMTPLPSVPMSPAPTAQSQTWSITINQYGGGCDICSGTYSGGGGGGGGGGTIGGGDPPPPPKCTTADCGTGDD